MGDGRPNVLILVVDCLVAEAFFNDAGRLPLPNMERLRERGTSFRSAFSVASTTSPCFSSLFTGTYPVIHGVRGLRGLRVRDDLPTMAEAFAGAGYRTSAYVTGPLLPTVGADRGFDVYEHRNRRQTIYDDWGKPVVERISRLGGDGPELLLLHTFVLHSPARRALRFAKVQYGRTMYDQALCNIDEYLGRLWDLVSWDDTVVALMADHGEIVSTKPWWLFTAVKRTGMSRVLTRLKLSPREAWTTGRHGSDITDVLTHVPLVFAGGPVAATGHEVRTQVSQVDILPTLADLADVPLALDGPLRGQSHVAALTGGESGPERPVFAEACGERIDPKNRLVGVRADGWKCIVAPENSQIPPRLYDLTSDPRETQNLADAQPDRLANYREMIDRDYLAHLPGEAARMSDEETRAIEEHLRDLGYL